MLNNLLIKKLNKTFVSSMTSNVNTVKQFLELYLSLGKIKFAEDVCQTDIVRPAMESILNERYLWSCQGGLKELYSQCYTFLKENLKYLLQAAAEQNNEYSLFTN